MLASFADSGRYLPPKTDEKVTRPVIDNIHGLWLYILRAISYKSVHITYWLHAVFFRDSFVPSETLPGPIQDTPNAPLTPAASADVHVHAHVRVSMTSSAAVCDPSAAATVRPTTVLDNGQIGRRESPRHPPKRSMLSRRRGARCKPQWAPQKGWAGGTRLAGILAGIPFTLAP
jgi:hypothetical protein